MIKKEKQLLLLDWLKRFHLIKITLKVRILKSIVFFSTINTNIFIKSIINFNLLDYRASISYPKTRCILTSRAYAIKQNMKISRFTFRRLASNKLIPFITRPSW